MPTVALAMPDPEDDLDLITIIGPDGQPMTIRPLGDDESAIDISGGGSRIPRIAAAQDEDDDRVPNPRAGLLFLTSSVYAIDEDTGKGVRASDVRVVGMEIAQAHLLGVRENRSFFPKKYDPRNQGTEDGRPACSSMDAKRPDPQFLQAKTAPAPMCVGRNAKGQIVPVCPMAQWSTDEDGVRVPPKCTYAIQAGFAFKDAETGEWVVFDAYFRRTSEPAGRQIFRNAKVLTARGLPLFAFPTKIKAVRAAEGKKGRVVIAVMSEGAADLDDDEMDKLAELTAFWNEAQEQAKARTKAAGQLGAGDQRPQLSAGPTKPADDEEDVIV